MNIILRPFRDEDDRAFAEAVNSSLDTLLPWLLWAKPGFSTLDARLWFAATRQLRLNDQAIELGLFSQEGELLGGAGVRFSQHPQNHCSLGYWVRSCAQRKGVASQAVKHLLDLAWQRPERDVVEILAVEDNIASRGVALKCGAQFVGIQHGLIVLNSGPVNTAVYHFLRPNT